VFSTNAPFDVYLTNIDVFQPDLLVVLNPNRLILTDAGAEGPPDFVVEILSLPFSDNLDAFPGAGTSGRDSPETRRHRGAD
jgi:Uma2 family endonuclease